jgi:hypothetical protein
MTDGKRKLGRPTESLSAEERAKRYRAAATEAFDRAGTTRDTGMRAEYFELAVGWHNLAFEIERAVSLAQRTAQKDKPAEDAGNTTDAVSSTDRNPAAQR